MTAPAMEPTGLYEDRSPLEKSTRSPSKRRRRNLSLFRRCKDVCLKHTWTIPLVLLTIVLSAYAINPNEANPIHKLLFLSYRLPPSIPGGPIMYGKGQADLAFVGFYTLVLSFTREYLMQRIIKPLGQQWGIKGKAKTARFMEQFYTAIYFAIFGPYGLYVMSHTDTWYFNTTAMFRDFPHKTHTAEFKAYYLLQASYWTQQAIVLLLQLEKPRKDFKELVGHHIVTLTLIGLSYRFHFTHIGLAVYITHDISDFFLATSKTLNYLDSPIIGPYFALFVVVWIYMRHYLNWRIIWAVLTEFRTVGPFELDWGKQQYKCWISQYIALILLSTLQAMNLFWLYLILRIAKNYAFSNVRQDERSDNEEEDEAEPDGAQMRTVSSQPIPTILLNGSSQEQARRRSMQKENPSSAPTNGSKAHNHVGALTNGKEK